MYTWFVRGEVSYLLVLSTFGVPMTYNSNIFMNICFWYMGGGRLGIEGKGREDRG